MPTTRQCAECGTPLPEEVPDGACPICALRAALESPDDLSKVAVTEKPGDHIGRYKLLEKIGEGGYGTVYMAEQAEPIRRRVALKVIKLGMDTRQVVARFEAERQALALMDHPNIAKVLDAGATDTGRPFFVMELVKGVRITDYCDRNSLSTDGRLGLFMQVCHAIQHAHQKGIIHRDLKPSNILVTELDGLPVPKVIDFGIAKATGQHVLTDKTLFTAFHQFIGTPAYMSPEQAGMSGADVDTRSDIYALGVLLYELLTSHLPFEKAELLQAGFDEMRRLIREKEPLKPSTRLSALSAEALTTVANHQHTEPPKLLHLVRGDLDWIAMKCLEKDRARRYQTASELAMDTQRHLDNDVVLARPPDWRYRLWRLIRRNRLAFGAAAGVVLALALGAAVSTWQAVRATRAERGQTEVARFLKQTLMGVGPSVAHGRDTTILREILEKTATRLGKDLEKQPEVEAEIRSTIASVYLELGNYDQAEKMAREALAIRRSKHLNPLKVADSLNNLGNVLYKKGKLPDSETAHREALAIRQKRLGADHPDVASSLSNLGNVLWGEGKLAQAEALFREALAIRKKRLGYYNEDTVASLDNLAAVLSLEDKLPEAEKMQREAVALNVKLLGNDHPDVAFSMNNLADTLREEGKLDEAEATNRAVLMLRKKLLGEEHPDVAASLHNLATVLAAEGKWNEAEGTNRAALAMRRKVLKNRHPDIAGSLSNLAGVLVQEQKLAEAETLQREALDIQKETLGPEHQDIAGSLNVLGTILWMQGKFAEAEGYQAAALAMFRKLMGNDSLDVARTLLDLGTLLRCEGKLTEAEPAQREGLAIREKVLGDQHPDVAVALDGLAATLFDQGKLADAERLQREELALWRKLAGHEPRQPMAVAGLVDSLARLARTLLAEQKFADAGLLARECSETCEKELPGDWRSSHARSLLGGSLMGQNKFSEAEPLLIAGYQGLKKLEATITPDDKPCLKEALQRLVSFYQATGQPERAAEWNKRLGEAQ
jgi:serine/threonine protein kinase/Tfp pilus assembly protein PilF